MRSCSLMRSSNQDYRFGPGPETVYTRAAAEDAVFSRCTLHINCPSPEIEDRILELTDPVFWCRCAGRAPRTGARTRFERVQYYNASELLAKSLAVVRLPHPVAKLTTGSDSWSQGCQPGGSPFEAMVRQAAYFGELHDLPHKPCTSRSAGASLSKLKCVLDRS